MRDTLVKSHTNDELAEGQVRAGCMIFAGMSLFVDICQRVNKQSILRDTDESSLARAAILQ